MILTSVFKFDSFKWEKMHEHIWIVCFVSVKLSCVREGVKQVGCVCIQTKNKSGFFIYYSSPDGPERFWSVSVIKTHQTNCVSDRTKPLILCINITLLIKHGALINCQRGFFFHQC